MERSLADTHVFPLWFFQNHVYESWLMVMESEALDPCFGWTFTLFPDWETLVDQTHKGHTETWKRQRGLPYKSRWDKYRGQYVTHHVFPWAPIYELFGRGVDPNLTSGYHHRIQDNDDCPCRVKDLNHFRRRSNDCCMGYDKYRFWPHPQSPYIQEELVYVVKSRWGKSRKVIHFNADSTSTNYTNPHETDRKYTCKLCQFDCCYWDCMYVHLSSRRHWRASRRDKKISYRCHFCNKLFPSWSKAIRHYQTQKCIASRADFTERVKDLDSDTLSVVNSFLYPTQRIILHGTDGK